jgi:hypothetical protein
MIAGREESFARGFRWMFLLREEPCPRAAPAPPPISVHPLSLRLLVSIARSLQLCPHPLMNPLPRIRAIAILCLISGRTASFWLDSPRSESADLVVFPSLTFGLLLGRFSDDLFRGLLVQEARFRRWICLLPAVESVDFADEVMVSVLYR